MKKLMVMRNGLLNWINSSIGITIVVFILFAFITIFLSWPFYNRSFYENILSNANASLIDLLIIGIILVWFNLRREQKEQISKWTEEIDDFRYWKAAESTYRIAGNIRRLNKLRMSKINLFKCNISGSYLKDVNLNGAWLFQTNFSNSNLNGANFENAQCIMADFSNSLLYKANLRFTELSGTIFFNTDLSNADFTGAKGLTAEQLSKTSSLWNAKFDKDVLDKIQSTCSKQLNAADCRCSDELWEPERKIIET